jgi:hypothetical protein
MRAGAEFVYETLSSYGDYEIVYSAWVKKINPKGKVQKRLLVLGPFHIFSFKMGAFGKKGLQRCGHYYELYELHATKTDQVPTCARTHTHTHSHTHTYTHTIQFTLCLRSQASSN